MLILMTAIVTGQHRRQLSNHTENVGQTNHKSEAQDRNVPKLLSYQGLLTKANGKGVQDGTYDITFRLYQDSDGEIPFWEEAQNVVIADGIISVTLGKNVEIGAIPTDAYLEIEINGTTLSPRQEMTSVFYAMVSDTAKYAQKGNYTELDSLPDLSLYAKKDTLDNYSTTSSYDSVAFTGDYNDLNNLPNLDLLDQSDTLNFYVMTDSLSAYTLTSGLSAVATTGEYSDLSGAPDISVYATNDTLASYTLTSDLAAQYQPADADLDDLADGTLSASKVENNEYFITSAGEEGQIWVSDGSDAGNWETFENVGITGAATTIDTEDLTPLVAMATDSDGKVSVSDVTSTELGYLGGVTDSLQNQIDSKQAADADLDDLADGTLSASKVENNEYFITSAGTNGQVWTSDGDGAGAWATSNATTVTVTDNENTNEGNALVFVADADLDGGDSGLESDGDATYNPSTGTITATNFSGNLTGTLQTAAQGNVTSLGTLTALTVDNVVTDGAAIGHTDDTDLMTLANGSVTFTGTTVVGTADINGGAIDGAAIGANSATTGDFTTITASTSLDVTGSAGVILENDETITNSTNGTVLINGTVAGGTGSAAGVFQSNGDNDVTLQTGNSTTGSITITDGADGDITVAPNGTGKTDFNDNAITGYGADLQTLSGTSKTLAAADNGTVIVCSSNSAITITVPASLPSGFNCMIIQNGSGQVSLSASSTTLNNRNGSATAGQYAIMTLVHLGSNVFVVSGDTTS